MKWIVLYYILFVNILYSNPLVIDVSYEDKATYPYYLGEGANIDFNKPGLIIEAIISLEKKLNVKFNFKREVSKRGQKKLEYNKIDMLLFASFEEGRRSIGVYPFLSDGSIDTQRRTMSLSYHLYTLKDSTLDWDGHNFLNLNGEIGATKGYSIVEFLQNKNVKVSENSSNLGDSQKLIQKRIQGFVNQDSKIDPYLKQNPELAKYIKKIKIPIKTKPYYILFSHKFYQEHQDLVNKIWDELQQIDSAPQFKSIKDKYEAME